MTYLLRPALSLSSRRCPLHWVGGPAFTGGLAISQARATHVEGNWQLVTTDGELRRPKSSRCTDGDATTAPILACRSRHSAWLRVGQSGHVELPGTGAPPPQRHARLSGRPRSFPVSPMVRHSMSSYPPCRIRQSRSSGAGPRRRRGVAPRSAAIFTSIKKAGAPVV